MSSSLKGRDRHRRVGPSVLRPHGGCSCHRLLWGGPSDEIPVVWMQGARHPARWPCPAMPSDRPGNGNARRSSSTAVRRSGVSPSVRMQRKWHPVLRPCQGQGVWLEALRGSPSGLEATTGMRFLPEMRAWPFRWNPISSDARAVTPGSSALLKRPGRRRQRGFLVHPLQRLRAARDRHRGRKPTCLLCQTERPLSWRSRPEGARLVGPAGTEGAICDAALPGRTHQVGGPNKGGRFSLPRIVRLMALP